jgi:hypothetical protein
MDFDMMGFDYAYSGSYMNVSGEPVIEASSF